MAARIRCMLFALVSWVVVGGCLPAAAAGALADAGPAPGQALYLEGRHADGRPLGAARAGGMALAGAEAACVNCHRRSGLGGSEGRSYIPAIDAASLLAPMPAGKGASATGQGRPAYTEAALAQALRGGTDPGGRTLDYLMPRYDLSDADVHALFTYLGGLPQGRAAGADQPTVELATVVAPGVAPERARAMVDVLQACVDEHNAGTPAQRGRKRLASEMRPEETRPWRLHVWPLQGPAAGWDAQLAERARAQPVFAMVGGIGAGEWAPVHAFCERAGVPCLFPHVEAPVDDAGAFYPLYLGKGVLLDAGLIARSLGEAPLPAGRVVQVLRADDVAARAGADALERALARQAHVPGVARVAVQGPLAPSHFAHIDERDAVVLWLRPGDLQQLAGIAPVGARVFLSGTLAERDEVAAPAAWQARAVLAYPFELPSERATPMTALRRWLQARGVAPGDERVQADAYVACAALRAAMPRVELHPGGDYLVERLESDLERTTATGLYPRLALGIGQRFAAKAGYLVRFDGERPGQFVPLGERSAP